MTTWTGERVLLCCLQQSFITYSGTTASSSSFGRDTAVDLNGGAKLYSCTTLATGLFGGGACSDHLHLVGPPRGQAMAPCWSLARLDRAPGRGRLCHRLFTAVGPAAEWRSARHHCPQHEECGLSSSSVLVLAVAVAIHTHIKAIIPLLHLGFWRCVGAATSAPGIEGPSCSILFGYPNGDKARLPGQWRGR